MENHWLSKLIHNPKLQLAAGLLLLAMTLFGEFFHPHHGFILIGAYWVAQAIPNIVQSLERIYKGVKK